MFGVGTFTLIRWGLFAAVLVFLGTLAYSYVHDYKRLVVENVTLKNDIKKYDGRLASYKRMIDRRDAAIKASQCKSQITRWLHHPDEIPQPFDPYTNSPLAPPQPKGQPNALDTEPVAPLPPLKLPDLSPILPWNWF